MVVPALLCENNTDDINKEKLITKKKLQNFILFILTTIFI